MEHVTVPCWFTAACCYHIHYQDVTLAGGRHMTAPPSNATGHLAIRPHHQLIVYQH